MSLPDAAGWVRPGTSLATGVAVCVTTREGTLSPPPWQGFNLGLNCDDDPQRVAQARAHVAKSLGVTPLWLRQVHGTRVVTGEQVLGTEPQDADGCIVTTPGLAAAVLTADCLPVVMARTDGSAVGAFHAGWRGLLAGILEQGLAQLAPGGEPVSAWIGPAICAACYQVDDRVRDAFMAANPLDSTAFAADGPGHWRLDLPGLAADRLLRAGVHSVAGGHLCTRCDNQRFYSYRAEPRTGRFATLIWLKETA